MKRKFLHVLSLIPALFFTFSTMGQTATDLFISEYVEGGSFNKYIEIYNGTGSTVDLSNYAISLHSNGNTIPTAVDTLSGMLANGAVMVYAHSSATIYTGTVTALPSINFNGDDAVVLTNLNTSAIIDIFGVVGDDPGTAWTGTVNTTVNKTLVRKSTITEGVLYNPSGTGPAAFITLDSEWIMFSQDNVSNLGMHTMGTGSMYHKIADYTMNDSFGQPDSLNVPVMFKGVVVGVDMDGNNGFSFTINDGDGINVYTSSDKNGYVVREGDEVETYGKIAFYNGLTEIALDSIMLVDSNKMLPAIKTVTMLDESTESELVMIENVTMVNPAQWTGSGSGFNVDITNGVNTFVMRVDADVDLYSEAAPTGMFDVIGIVGQFDFSSPYFDGYQLFPRYKQDIIPHAGPSATVSIGSITTNDTLGSPDSLGKSFWIQGVVVGVDMDGNTGYSFTLHDGDGINIYNYADVDNYQVVEGDEIAVHGTVGFFRGLTQFSPDTIVLLSRGMSIPTVAVITTLDESTESELVKLENLLLVNPSQWPADGSSANVDVTNGVDTFVVRIDSDTDIDGTPAPSDTFDIIGIGGQYDASSPYFDGYQLFPRYSSDIIEHGKTYEKLVINEFLANSSSTNQWIELYNPNANDVSLNGWYLSDSKADSTQWAFPDTSIASKGYLLVWDMNDSSDLHCSFELNTAGEELVLANPDMEVIEFITFGAQREDTSYARIPNGTGMFKYAMPTPAAANAEFPKPIPMYTISQINSVTAGEADSVNVYCKLEGVVFSKSIHASNIQTWMDDGTGGINVFQYSSAGLTYVATPGDKIRVIGKIAQYRGLLEIMPDSIVVIATNQTQPTPLVVSTLDETNENLLVKIKNLSIVDTTTNDAYGININATNGTTTFVIRIDDLSELYNANNIDTSFDLTGISVQYTSSSSVYLDGYQIQPRYLTDVELHQPQSISENGFANNFRMFPNPNNGQFMLANNSREKIEISVISSMGQVVYHTMTSSVLQNINLNAQASGIYFVRVNEVNGDGVYSGRVIVK
ncbi:lamin tail domain-containing protein [Bacteroidota bacterium]